MHTSLLKWYETNGRHDLPWRQTRDIYKVYISEIMLQQTQVSRVQEYFYPRFLEEFPTIQDLANAKIENVLSLWSGLGYYSRARNIHKTAQLCSSTNLPTSKKELLKLPGIGEYTSSAICSFALEQDIEVVDTNIKRVLKRFFAIEENNEKVIIQKAQDFLNIGKSRDHNLALMDLGSMVCTPNNPQCEMCPLEKECQGKLDPSRYNQTKKIIYEDLELFLGICIKNNKIALIKSKEKLYKDMLTLPNVDPIEEDYIDEFKHSYTKYKITVKLYNKEEIDIEGIEYFEIDKSETLPISSLTKKAIKKIN
jgi:A/G-specific adenine glycosylase